RRRGEQAGTACVSDVNDHGGLDGHPIQYIVADAASDPPRHAAAVKDLVENRGVIAFVGQYASQTHQGARQYIEDHHVPVIGGEVSLDLWYQSPMYFPQSPPFE